MTDQAKLEEYNFKGRTDRGSFFDHLMLGSTNGGIHTLVKKEGYDADKLMVDLKINDVSIRIMDFNELLDKWEEQIRSEMIQKMDAYDREDRVKERALDMIRTMAYEFEDFQEYMERED